MLIWRILTDGATVDSIDRDPHRAYAWLRRYVPDLFIRTLDEDGKPYLDEDRRERVQAHFDWNQEWPRWQRCFEALLLLVSRKRIPPHPGTLDDRIPLWVHDVLDDTIGKTRSMILADRFSDLRLVIQFCGDVNTSGRIASLEEFWQVVFVSFLQPDALPFGGSYCGECGKPLPLTGKHKKLSRAALCLSCRVKKCRRAHPEETREAWREDKKRARAAERKSRPVQMK